jgi:hypothetical protein
MTPMAGRVTNTDENGFVFFLGLFKGFRFPGVPVDWVMSVLEQVRTGFVLESVHKVKIRYGILAFCSK